MTGVPLSALKARKDLPVFDDAPALRDQDYPMLKIRMLTTQEGSLNGRDTRTYQAGETYELPDQGTGGLADVFLREGWAELVVPVAPEPLELQRYGLTLHVAPGVDEELRNLAVETPQEADPLTPHRCRAVTSRGTQCERDAVGDTDFCAVPAHAKQAAA